MTAMDPGPVTAAMVQAAAEMTVAAHQAGRALLCDGCRVQPDACLQLAWAERQLDILRTGGDVLVVS
jgi:hypothetical protein